MGSGPHHVASVRKPPEPKSTTALGHRREREVVREGHHHVARVLREALDARQEGDRAGDGGGREHAMMPTMAARPLRISHLRPRSFCSAVRFAVKLKGSQRLRRKWPPGPPLPLISG